MRARNRKARRKTRKARGKSGNARVGKNGTKKLAESLRRDVGLVADKKNGDPSEIHIAVGEEVGQSGHEYRRDITFIPTVIHLRERRHNPSGKPDFVQWKVDWVGKSTFKLKFKAGTGSPFVEGDQFDEGKAVGTVMDGASGPPNNPEVRYHYALIELTLDNKPIDLDPMHCPEIIIQK